MIAERHVLTLAVGYRDDARVSKGRGSRRRSRRAPAHEWVDRAGGGRVCRWCAMRDGEGWHGAREGCGNAHARNVATKKTARLSEAERFTREIGAVDRAVARAFRDRDDRKNEEARAACDSTGLGDANSMETR